MYYFKKKTLITFLTFCLLSSWGFSQEVWSLQRCIDYALENNLSIKQATANVKMSLLSERQAKAARLPNLSANINAGEQFGRTIDPTTNTFKDVAVGFNSLGLSGGVNIFNGGQINHSIKQASWDLKAASADAEQQSRNIALQVAAAYLNILLTEEQLENAARRINQSNQQLNVTQKLIDAGTIPMGDKYNVLAQIARDEQVAVQTQNTLDLAYLSLKQLLQLEPDTDLKIEKPNVTIPSDAAPELATLPSLYQSALGTQTGVQAAAFRIRSAEEGIAIARSAYYPTIGLGFNANANYSTAFDIPSKFQTVTAPPRDILVNGVPVTVDFLETANIPTEFKTVSYLDQLDQTFGQSIGVNISIPLYQNGRTRLGVERARLSLLNAKLQENQVQQQLKNDIQTAIANAKAAKKQLDAAQKTFEALQIAYQNTEKRHALGAVNTFDLTTAKTNLDNAENDVVVARYDYIFKLKILDFYQGKTLTVN